MLERDDLPGYRLVLQSRISDPDRRSGPSLDRQDRNIRGEVQILEKNYAAEVIEQYQVGESASTMERETLDDVLQKAKRNQFDVLMVWAVHRFTRANPWDTFEYLLQLRDSGVVIYSHRDGYFDWSDTDDAKLMATRVANARSWRNEIDRGARENNRLHLQQSRWPYGPTPYGTIKEPTDDDRDHVFTLKDGYEWVIQAVFESFLEGKNEDEISDHINSLVEQNGSDIDPPTKYQINNILENEVFVGHLVLKRSGELVRVKEDLRCIDESTFTAVQEIRQDNEPKENDEFGPQDFPDFVYQLIARYGQEYAVDEIDAIRWCCPVCQVTDINISDTTIEYWEIQLPKIYCKVCGYNGPSIRMRELNEIDFALPLICSECQRTSGFDVKPLNSNTEYDNLYKYTCQHCGEMMIKDKQPNAVQRGFQNSANRINLREDNITDSDSGEEEANADSEEKRCCSRNAKVDDQLVLKFIDDSLDEFGPQEEAPQSVIMDAVKILIEEGALETAELKDRLISTHPTQYSTANSMWYSTVARYYEQIPGLCNPERGIYDFDLETIQFLLSWTKEAEVNEEND